MDKALFISPHPDDIAYSCILPSLRSDWDKTIMTIFGRSRYAFGDSKSDIDNTSIIRKQEDERFAQYVDANLIYCTFDDSSITYSNQSNYTSHPNRNEIYTRIENEIINNQYKYVFFPIGVGWHFDHQVIRDIIVKEIIPRYSGLYSCKFYMYEDYPYIIDYSREDYAKFIEDLLGEYSHITLQRIHLSACCINEQTYSLDIYESQRDNIEIGQILHCKIEGSRVIEKIWNIVMI